jgi:hypothetical protein
LSVDKDRAIGLIMTELLLPCPPISVLAEYEGAGDDSSPGDWSGLLRVEG